MLEDSTKMEIFTLESKRTPGLTLKEKIIVIMIAILRESILGHSYHVYFLICLTSCVYHF
jgi:hypothetical protein